jgi:hypothetical protein
LLANTVERSITAEQLVTELEAILAAGGLDIPRKRGGMHYEG